MPAVLWVKHLMFRKVRIPGKGCVASVGRIGLRSGSSGSLSGAFSERTAPDLYVLQVMVADGSQTLQRISACLSCPFSYL